MSAASKKSTRLSLGKDTQKDTKVANVKRLKTIQYIAATICVLLLILAVYLFFVGKQCALPYIPLALIIPVTAILILHRIILDVRTGEQ